MEDELLQSKPKNPPRKEIHFLQVVLPSAVQLKCLIIILFGSAVLTFIGYKQTDRQIEEEEENVEDFQLFLVLGSGKCFCNNSIHQ